MVDQPYILADFPVDDPLSNYFSMKGFEHDFMPEDIGVPLVDQIKQKIEGKKDVVLILAVGKDNKLGSLARLFEEKSIYNNFKEMVDTAKIEIILYSNTDTLVGLCWHTSPDLISWINELRPFVLADGIAGKWFKGKYNKCRFIEIGNPFFNYGKVYPQFSTLKKHKPSKDFLCLMSQKRTAKYRDILDQQMLAKDLIGKNIYRFGPRNANTFDDLQYPFDIGYKTGWPDGVPVIHYYNQTNLEVVAETFGDEITNDGFFITEKTIKPITMRHPFMVLSSFHFLKNLRNLGFRTFGDHIDESYDLEQDVNKRIEIITNNLKHLKGTSSEFYKNTCEIRDHNLLNLQNQIGTYQTNLWRTMDEFFKNL